MTARTTCLPPWADSGALVMGRYDGSTLPMWNVARNTCWPTTSSRRVWRLLFNHIQLVCACAPYYPNADKSPAKDSISVVEADGKTLKVADNAPASAIKGAPKFGARRQPDAGFLRRQHHAAALSASSNPRPPMATRPTRVPFPSPIRCRRSMT